MEVLKTIGSEPFLQTPVLPLVVNHRNNHHRRHSDGASQHHRQHYHHHHPLQDPQRHDEAPFLLQQQQQQQQEKLQHHQQQRQQQQHGIKQQQQHKEVEQKQHHHQQLQQEQQQKEHQRQHQLTPPSPQPPPPQQQQQQSTMTSDSKTPLSSQSHLEPFRHQVAGQSLVFRYDPSTICKSLIPREHQFYKTLPDVLIPHVPQYRGVVDIPLNEPDSGEENGGAGGERGEGAVTHPLATRRILDKVARPSQADDNVYHFILLENIVAELRQPCILDLKMGTRQHGDDAPAHKKAYQVNKCRATTSAQLGVRLCGMKLYQPTTGEYVQVDKAEGRRMREDDFREAMRQFLFNGYHLRRDLIPSLLHRLRSLRTAIAQLPSYRFYSSSLLIVYDGVQDICACLNSVSGSAELRMSKNKTHGYTSDNKTPYCVSKNKTQGWDSENENASRCRSNGMSLSDQDEGSVNSPRDLNGCFQSEVTSALKPGSDPQKIFTKHQNEEAIISIGERSDSLFPSSNGAGLSTMNGDLSEASIHQDHYLNTPIGVGNGIQQRETHSPESISQCLSGDYAKRDRDCAVDQMPRTELLQENVPASAPDSEKTSLADVRLTGASAQKHDAGLNTSGLTNTSVLGDEKIQTVVEGDVQQHPSEKQTSAEYLSGSPCTCGSDGKIDVRMVDFAHTTFDGFPGDSVIHSGTDHGYLRGLQTLIDTFEQLYAADCS